MWAPGGGIPAEQARLLPRALLPLPCCCCSSFFLFFPLPSESFLVLRIEVRRWSRGSINWRVGDAPRRPLKLFQACPVFYIIFSPWPQAEFSLECQPEFSFGNFLCYETILVSVFGTFLCDGLSTKIRICH
jgi:hypothetical protein